MLTIFVLVCLLSVYNPTECYSTNDVQRLKEAESHLEELIKALDEQEKVCNKTKEVQLRGKRATDEIVAFSATITNDITPLGNNEVIVYDRVITNIGGAYDGLIGRFKAKVAGVYHFIATIMSYSSYFIEVEMVKDGTTLCRFRASNTHNAMGTCVANIHLNVGNDVWVRHYGTSGTYIRGSHYSSFAGHLIASV